ncbi:MAG: NAD(P)H-binding protein [Polyangiaceae bacterium]
MIVITGACGNLGSRIVERLLERFPATSLGVSTRRTARAIALTALGVRVRRGDFDEPATLVHAFEGASQVLIVSTQARAFGWDPLEQHRRAIAAAKAAGARRILYTSQQGASHASKSAALRDHARTEDLLNQSGVPWTALRNGVYARRAQVWLTDALTSGTLQAPPDGPVSWVTHDDLAEATARILTEEGGFEGPTPPLTGPEALTLEELAGMAAGVSGVALRREIVTEAEQVNSLEAVGIPPRVAGLSLDFYRASHAGEFAGLDPCLENLLGRPPQRALEWMASPLWR